MMKKLSTFFTFWTIHLLAFCAFFITFKPAYIYLYFISYFIRVFGLGAGFHRYFCHHSFKTSRTLQFIMAFLGSAAMQSSLFWWVSNHRVHHKFSDEEKDPHTPQKGFYWAHLKWFWTEENEEINYSMIPDLVKFPELIILNKYYLIPGLIMIGILLLLGGFNYLVWGFCVPTVVLWHSTFLVNSVGHTLGTAPYDTKDNSKNMWWMTPFLVEECWHNNHHHYPSSCRSGFLWWQFDYTYLILKFLSFFGIVWKLTIPPESVKNQYKNRTK